MNNLIAIDIETACNQPSCPDFGKSICRNDHSLSPWHGKITKVALVITNDNGVFHKKAFDNVDEFDVALNVWLRKTDLGVTGHNFKFDWLWLKVHGVDIPLERWQHDSQLAAFVLTDKIPDSWLADYEERRGLAGSHHRKAGKHSLKTLAPYFLGVEPFWETADHDNAEYALKDAEYTARLTVVLEEKLRAAGQYEFYKEKLLPWAKMLVEAELRGIEIDMGAMGKLEEDLRAKSQALKAELDRVWADAHKAYGMRLRNELSRRYETMADKAGKEFRHGSRYWLLYENARAKLQTTIDYDSPKQMLWLMRDYLGYDVESLEGKDTTGREVLERLADEGKTDVATYLEWRRTNKILTAFLPTYRQLAAEGTLHPIYNATGTRTGRLSSERPNAQQVPPQLRPLFTARPGYTFVGYDQAAIEARLIALYTEDPALNELVSSGASLHDYNTTVFFGLDTPVEEVKAKHPIERQAAKNVGFALFYHAGANRIRVAFAQKGFHLSDAECKRLLYRFREAYATAFEFARGVVSYMEEGGVLANLCGRPLKIENAEDAYMTAFNTLIQSSASDLLLEGAHRALVQMRDKGIEVYPALFVHDFVAFEVADAHVAEADALIRDALTNFELKNALGQIKLEVEGGVSKRWEK
jgi:DNA polymerase-1